MRLEHRGFERMPGVADFLASYDAGWRKVLGSFSQHATLDSLDSRRITTVRKDHPWQHRQWNHRQIGLALQRFYSELFDWQVQDAGDESGYDLVQAAEKGIAGGIGAAQDGGEGQVSFYVEVDDLTAICARSSSSVDASSSRHHHRALRTHVRRFADPEGHVVGLSKGAPVTGGHGASEDTTDEHHVAGVPLPTISDDTMREWLGGTRESTVVLIRKTNKCVRPEVDPIIWEHGRRNFALREHSVLAIFLPVADLTDWGGLYVFASGVEEVREIIDTDPGVNAGIFTYELHPVRGFPGSALP